MFAYLYTGSFCMMLYCFNVCFMVSIVLCWIFVDYCGFVIFTELFTLYS
jgi:hypothetical protein